MSEEKKIKVTIPGPRQGGKTDSLLNELKTKLETAHSALRIIRTWASCELKGTAPGAFSPTNVLHQCKRGLGK